MEQKFIIRRRDGSFFLGYMEGHTCDKSEAYPFTKEEVIHNLEDHRSWLSGCVLIPIIPYIKAE